MNTKEELITFFTTNGIQYELVGNQLLFTYKGRAMVASGFGTIKVKSFRIEVTLTSSDGDTFHYSSLEEIRTKHSKSNDEMIMTFGETVENNDDKSLSESNLLKVLDKIESTDYIAQAIKIQTIGPKLFAEVVGESQNAFESLYKTLKDCSKETLLIGAEFLKGIADSIPAEGEKHD